MHRSEVNEMHKDIKEILFTEEQIRNRCDELARNAIDTL